MFLNDLKNRLQSHAIPIAINVNANTLVLISSNEMTFSNNKGKLFILMLYFLIYFNML